MQLATIIDQNDVDAAVATGIRDCGAGTWIGLNRMMDGSTFRWLDGTVKSLLSPSFQL